MAQQVKYDEFQLSKRHKIGYQAFIILLIAVWINGIFKSRYGVWAEPMVEMIVLLMIPAFYFSGASIWRNAYLRFSDNPRLILVLFGFISAVGLLSLNVSIFSGTFTLVENGQLGGNIGAVIMTCLFSMMFVLLLIRRRVDRIED